MTSSNLIRCGNRGCHPSIRINEGEEHTGFDLYVRCLTCNRRGPHVECERSTPELKAKVAQAWNGEVTQ